MSTKQTKPGTSWSYWKHSMLHESHLTEARAYREESRARRAAVTDGDLCEIADALGVPVRSLVEG